MKLRNKHTRKIWNIPKRRYPTVQEDDISFFAEREGEGKLFSYNSLAELNADWEDVESADPLIKDKKIRKAVRAWAKACGAKQIKYSIALNQYYDADMGTGFSIKFLIKPIEVYLEEGKIYTIAELCGEEEE